MDSDADHEHDPGETLMEQFVYDLNPDGTRWSATETDDQNHQRLFRWAYDAMGRLSSEVTDMVGSNGEDYTTVYDHDLSGNRTGKRTDHAPGSQTELLRVRHPHARWHAWRFHPIVPDHGRKIPRRLGASPHRLPLPAFFVCLLLPRHIESGPGRDESEERAAPIVSAAQHHRVVGMEEARDDADDVEILAPCPADVGP